MSRIKLETRSISPRELDSKQLFAEGMKLFIDNPEEATVLFIRSLKLAVLTITPEELDRYISIHNVLSDDAPSKELFTSLLKTAQPAEFTALPPIPTKMPAPRAQRPFPLPSAPIASHTPALHKAARHNRDDIVTLLTSLGANRNEENNHGMRPVDTATKHGHLNIAKYLLAMGAEPSKSLYSDSAEQNIALRNDPELLSFLASGADRSTPEQQAYAASFIKHAEAVSQSTISAIAQFKQGRKTLTAAVKTPSMYEKATIEFTAAISAAPYYTQAYYQRGLCHAKLGRDQEAMADFSEVIKIDRQSLNIVRNEQMHNADAAAKLKQYKEGREQSIGTALYARAQSLERLGHTISAYRDLSLPEVTKLNIPDTNKMLARLTKTNDTNGRPSWVARISTDGMEEARQKAAQSVKHAARQENYIAVEGRKSPHPRTAYAEGKGR